MTVSPWMWLALLVAISVIAAIRWSNDASGPDSIPWPIMLAQITLLIAVAGYTLYRFVW